MSYEDGPDEEQEEQFVPAKILPPDPLTVILPPEILSQLVENAAQRLANSLEREAKQHVHKMIEREFKVQMKEHIRRSFEEYIATAMDRKRKKTDEWGTETGSAVSFSELMKSEWQAYIHAKVNDRGEPGSYNDKMTRIEWFVKKHALEQLSADSKVAIDSLTAEARKMIQGSVSRYIAEQLTPTVSVKPMQIG